MRIFFRGKTPGPLAAVLLLAFCSCATLFGRKWQKFDSTEGHFSVEFPPGTVETIRDKDQVLYRLFDGEVAYAASSFEAESKNPSQADIDGAFAVFPVGFAKSVRGTIVSALPARHGSMQGSRTMIKASQGQCDLRLYYRGRFYFMAVCFPDARENRDSFARFFDSLTVR